MDLPHTGYSDCRMDAIRYGAQEFALLNRYVFHTIENSYNGLDERILQYFISQLICEIRYYKFVIHNQLLVRIHHKFRYSFGQEEFRNPLAAYTTMAVFTLKLIAENEIINDVGK